MHNRAISSEGYKIANFNLCVHKQQKIHTHTHSRLGRYNWIKMMKKRGGGAMSRCRYRKQQQQQQRKQLSGHCKWRSVFFSSEDRKSFFYQLIWTPVDIYQQIVLNRDANRFVYANTHGLFPFSNENIKYKSVFIAADEFDLAAANIYCHHPPAEVRSKYTRIIVQNLIIII